MPTARLLLLAFAIAAGSAVPLLIVGLFDPQSNPIGLGLLFVFGSLVAAGLAIVALAKLLWLGLSGRPPRGGRDG